MSLSLALGLAAAYWPIRCFVVAARMRRREWTLDPHSAGPTVDPGLVSICVPARDEAEVIGTCVQSLLHQVPPGSAGFELIVVDDRSSDGTAEKALAAAAGDARLRVVPGDGPPPGWLGKHAALWRAVAESRGDWLLFIDADVRLHPRALQVLLGAAERTGADMVSWLGTLVCQSAGERVALPFIGDLISLSAPPARVNDEQRDDCLANGQCILIRREVYFDVGGHETIRASVIDDVSLSRSVKFHQPIPYRYRLFHADGLMWVRMYRSFGEVWRGFSKNFHAAAQGRVLLLGMAALYILVMSVLPWVALPLLWMRGDARWIWAAVAVVGTVAYRLLTLRLLPVPWPWVLAHPIGALTTVGIIADSVLQARGWRRRVAWKGRVGTG